MTTQLDEIQKDIKDIKALIELKGVTAESVSNASKYSKPNENGCIEFYEITQRIKDWKERGDLYAFIANKTAQYYAVLQPGVILQEVAFQQVKANQDSTWAMGIIGSDIYIGDFYQMRGGYHNTVTDEYKFDKPRPYNKDYSQWTTTTFRQVGIIPNHATVSQGNLSDPLNPDFYKFFNAIPAAVFKRMDAELELLKVVGIKK